VSRAAVVRQLMRELLEYAEEQETGEISPISDALLDLFMQGKIYFVWDPKKQLLCFQLTEETYRQMQREEASER